MASFDGEFGAQFTIHIADQYTVPEIADLAERARKGGMNQVWVNDNLGYRNVFVTLAAIASRTPVKVGTAIAVPYYRNPIDVAGTLAALSELTDGRELSIGLGRGSLSQTGKQVETPKPYRMLRETAQCLRTLLDGEEITFGDYPLLTSYFNLQPGTTLGMSVTPSSPVRFYVGGHGPTALTVGGKFMDGVVLGGYFIPLARSGMLEERLATADEAAREAGRERPPRRVAELNLSIAEDRDLARAFPKPYVTHMLVGMRRMGFSDASFTDLGIDPDRVDDIEAAFEEGATIHEAANLVSDAMVDATFVAGTPEECLDQLEELTATAARHDIDQLVFAKLGPDYELAIDRLAEDVIPAIRS